MTTGAAQLYFFFFASDGGGYLSGEDGRVGRGGADAAADRDGGGVLIGDGGGDGGEDAGVGGACRVTRYNCVLYCPDKLYVICTDNFAKYILIFILASLV